MATPVEQQRDILRAGQVVAVLPVDLARDEIVLLRQFRLAAHLANGRGDLVEVVAGRVEAGEAVADAARRECTEEIGVAPAKLVELFSYLTDAGTDRRGSHVFLGAVDAARVKRRRRRHGRRRATSHPARADRRGASPRSTAAPCANGPLLIALQWLALNRGRSGCIAGMTSAHAFLIR